MMRAAGGCGLRSPTGRTLPGGGGSCEDIERSAEALQSLYPVEGQNGLAPMTMLLSMAVVHWAFLPATIRENIYKIYR